MTAENPPSAETILLAPNCSLDARSALLFFGSVCAVSFGIAGALALAGMWPILPFAGLEMLLLAWALRASSGSCFRDTGHRLNCAAPNRPCTRAA